MVEISEVNRSEQFYKHLIKTFFHFKHTSDFNDGYIYENAVYGIELASI